MLAVVYGCERFHTYLFGHNFAVHSDHKPLKSIHLKHLTAAPPRLQRMLLRLQPYDLVIKYQPEKLWKSQMLFPDFHQRKPAKSKAWTSRYMKYALNSATTWEEGCNEMHLCEWVSMRVESVLGSVLECVPCARVSNQIIVYTSPNYWNKINSATHSESLHSADTFFPFPTEV